MRLNKWISETGRCSRREADELIAAGRVTRNGAVADLGTQVEDGDDIRIDGEAVGRERPRAVYIAYHKPVGVVCTTERTVLGNIVDAVDHPERIFPIGRLDKDSEGLILLTNDGDIVNEVLRVEHDHDKEYLVAVDRNLTDEALATMARGVRIDPGSNPTGTTVMTRPCRIEKVGARAFRIVLTQGLNRQIRKMCEAVGYQVVGLQRVRIMHIELGHLKAGRWRNLTEAEVAGLKPKEPRPPAPRPAAPPPPKASKPAAPPAKPRAKPIPFGQPGAPGGPPLGRGGRGRGR
ncbi:MAG TPA: pseudouridine synthase [Kofleriaceae bacterium]|nr:pseudouridine synthase [Kofleriaceae bacterium]